MSRRRLVLAASLALIACGDDASDGPSDAGALPDAGPAPLTAALSAPSLVDVGEAVTLDATASTGAESFVFDLGDGRQLSSESGAVEASWDAPGRYTVVVTARAGSGATRSASTSVGVTLPAVHAPLQSGTLTRLEGDRFAAISEDGATLTVATLSATGELALERRIDTPAAPRTVTRWQRPDGEWLAVPTRDALLLVRSDGSERHEVPMPAGSRPYAALPTADDTLWVSLQGTGELAEVAFDGTPSLAGRAPVVSDARGLALLPDGRVAVSRWRSSDEGGEIALFDPVDRSVQTVTLQVDPRLGSDVESGGVPSYLDQVLVSPTGERVVVPALQANVNEGLFVSGTELRSDTTVRAVLRTLTPAEGAAGFEERFVSRRLLDDRGLASAAVFTSRGDFLFVATRGARTVERFDILGESESGTILGVGFAPDGLALTEDDRFLVVNASLSRELEVYEVAGFTTLPVAVSRLATVDEEPLDAQLLLGKQLFNDAADPRLTADSYIACAHCHLEGDSDHRVWDFTQRGEGLRKTPPLFGRMDQAPFHWSGNFDELHDFENDIRLHFDGTGLMEDADFEATAEPFGEPKAGRSEALDALVAYMRTLDAPLPSPHRDPDGSLTEAAERGQTVFETAGCPTCHAAPSYTDSALVDGEPVLHDVGTISEASGGRLGGPLDGLDTPTLRGLWHHARYLHDGSAETLEAVLTSHNPSDAHGATSALSAAEIADLVAFLRQL